MSWEAILVLVVGSYGCKLFGHVVLARLAADGGTPTGPLRWFPDLAALIPAALFAALVAVQTFSLDDALTVDARAAGVAVGAIAVWRKAPFVLIVVLAMAVTAAIRWQTSG